MKLKVLEENLPLKHYKVQSYRKLTQLELILIEEYHLTKVMVESVAIETHYSAMTKPSHFLLTRMELILMEEYYLTKNTMKSAAIEMHNSAMNKPKAGSKP